MNHKVTSFEVIDTVPDDKGSTWYKIRCYHGLEEWIKASVDRSSLPMWELIPLEPGYMWVHERVYGYMLLKGV